MPYAAARSGCDRVHLAELEHDRAPGREGGRVVEVRRVGDLGAVGQGEGRRSATCGCTRNGPTPSVRDGPVDRLVEVVDPVADMVERVVIRASCRRVTFVQWKSCSQSESMGRGLPTAEDPDARSTMKLTHLGHACLLVETDGARLLIDPGTMSAFEDVRDLDAVLVTHQHPDHLDLARLRRPAGRQPGRTAGRRPRHRAAVADGLGLRARGRPDRRPAHLRRHHGRRARRPARGGLRRRPRLHQRGVPARRRRAAAPR